MDLQLFSIEQMPPTVPLWDTILEDLGRPPAARVARVLGVGRTTVYRWNASGNAPRCALLALYWLTRWGRSAVHTQATNDALMAVQLARSYREECNRLRALGPDELAWPAIEPDRPERLSSVETRTLSSASCDAITDLCVVCTETSPRLRPFLRTPARSSVHANTAPIPPIQGGATPMKTACQGATTTAPARPTAPAKKGGARSTAAKSEVARAGTPLSVARPERPASVGGVPPTPPAPRARSTRRNAR